MTKLSVHIGGTLDDSKRRLAAALARAESGEAVEEHHLTFENWATFARLMTANRLEVLHYVHRHRPRSIRALAEGLGRDYRRVHEDVEHLAEAGLLDRSEAGLRADFDAIEIAL